MRQIRWTSRAVVLLLLLHAAALIQSAQHNDDKRTEILAGTDVTTVESAGLGSGQPGQREPSKTRTNSLKRISGAPVQGQFIVMYKPGVDVVAASASSKAQLVAFAQQQAAAAAGGPIRPSAAESAIDVASVIQPRDTSVLGVAVIKVDPTWALEQVRVTLTGPEVKYVEQDTYITLDPVDTRKVSSSSSSSNSNSRSQVGNTPATEAAAAAGAPSRVAGTAASSKSRRGLPPRAGSSPLPSQPPPSPAPAQPVDCSGRFSAWTECRLDYPPMWHACVRYRTFLVNVTAANGGRGCRWRNGRVQWRSCSRTACKVDPGPSELNPLPVKPLEGNERGDWGMGRVGSYNRTDKTVVDITDRMAQFNSGTGSSSAVPESLFVAVVDTGIDRTHPDLVVAGIMDLADEPDSPYYEKDGNGHGTHVSGIIGARANAKWGVGVVPGMPIYALKVLDQFGSGMKSDVLRAFDEILKLLQQGAKVAAVNLSLVLNASSQQPPSEADTEIICGYVKQMAAYGTAVVAAAGNQEGMDVTYKLPAACPDALAVTATDWNDNPMFFSNYAHPNNPQWVYDTIMAAPGAQVWSTWPLALGAGPYTQLDGTSAAAPFVAGGAAMCILANGCKISSVKDQHPAAQVNYPVLQALAKKQPCGRWKELCGPDWGSRSWGADAYYGFMLNVSMFRSN